MHIRPNCSDVNNTFLSRPRQRLFSHDQGKTLLATTTEQITIHFCNGHKMNPTVYTENDTTHRCRGADFSFQWRTQDFWMGVGSEPRIVGYFFYF